jgi:hypothetical protein
LADQGARLVVAEIPDDSRLANYRAVLATSGLAGVARVDDYYRDGVALLILATPTQGISHPPFPADG